MTSFLSVLSRFLRRLFGSERNGLGRSLQQSSHRRTHTLQRTHHSYSAEQPPSVRGHGVVSNYASTASSTAVAEGVVPALRQLVYQATCDMPKARMHAGQFGSRLRRIDPAFSYEKYNFTKLIYLLAAVPDIVHLERVDNPGAAPAYYIRSVLDVKSLLARVMVGFDSEDGWVHIDSVLSAMVAEAPTFSPETYGFSSLQSFLDTRTDLIEFNPDNANYIRLSQPASSPLSLPGKSSPRLTSPTKPRRGDRSRRAVRPTGKAAPATQQLPQKGADQRGREQTRAIVHLSKFAGFTPQVLNQKVSELAAIALAERWYFGPQPPANFAYPILKSYLRYTFIRLQHERKVIASGNQQYYAFNTGLLDKLLRPIYALLSPSSTGAPVHAQSQTRTQTWTLNFCIPGEGQSGKALVTHFTHLPSAANYLSDPSKVFYHLAAGAPEVDWHHIIKDNMERLPSAFLAQYAPANFTHRNTQTLSGNEFHTYKKGFATALDHDPVAYRNIVSRLEDALARTLLKTQINYKTAVPTYYPNINSIDLLLPICLVEEDMADCAIVARQADSGKYIGHTILTLRQAYNNARLICKLDEHWLTRSMALSQEAFEEDDDDDDDSEEFEVEVPAHTGEPLPSSIQSVPSLPDS